MDDFNNFNAESLPPGVVADTKQEEEITIEESNVFTHLGSSNWKHRKLSLEFLLSKEFLNDYLITQIKSSIVTLLGDKIASNKALALSLFFNYLKQLTNQEANITNQSTSASELSTIITALIKNKIIVDKKLTKTITNILEHILDNVSLTIDEIQSSIIKPLIVELDQKSAMIILGCLRVVWHLYQTYGLEIMPGMITLNKLKNAINSPNKELKELSFKVLLFLSEESNLGSSAIAYVKDKMNLKANLLKDIEKRYEEIKGKQTKRDYKLINFIDPDNNSMNSNDKCDTSDAENKVIEETKDEKDILLNYKKNFVEEYNNCVKWKEKIVLIEELKRICVKNKKFRFTYKKTKLEVITSFLVNQLINDRNSNVICTILELLNLIVVNVKEELNHLTKKLYPNCFVWFKEKRSSIESNVNSLIDNWFVLVSNKQLEDFMGYAKKYTTDKMPRNKLCILNYIKRSCVSLHKSNKKNVIEDDTFTDLIKICVVSFNDGNNEVRDLSVELFKKIMNLGEISVIQNNLLNLNERKNNERAVKKFAVLSGIVLAEENNILNKDNTIKYKTIRKTKTNTVQTKEQTHIGFIESSKAVGMNKKELMNEIIKNIDKVKNIKEINQVFGLISVDNGNKYKTIKSTKVNRTTGTVRGLKTIKTIKPYKTIKSNIGTVKKVKNSDIGLDQAQFTLTFINKLLSHFIQLNNKENSEDLNEFFNIFNEEINYAFQSNNINSMTPITEQAVGLIDTIVTYKDVDFFITDILNKCLDSNSINLLNVYQFTIQTYSTTNYETLNNLLTALIQTNSKEQTLEIQTKLGEVISFILNKYVFSYKSNTDGNSYEIDLIPFITHYNIPLKQSVINADSSHTDIKITPFNTPLLLNLISKLGASSMASTQGISWEVKKAVLESINGLLLENIILLIEDNKDLEDLKVYFVFIKGCLSDSNKKIVFLALNSLSLFVSKSADLAFFITTIVEMDDLISCLNDKQQGISEEANKILVLLIKRTGDLCALNRLVSIALSPKTPKKDKFVTILFAFKKLITANFLQSNLPKFIYLLFDKSYKVREFSSLLKEHCKDEQFKEAVLNVLNKVKKENEKKIIIEALNLQINNENNLYDNSNNNNNDNIKPKNKRNTLPNSPTLKSPIKTLRRVSMKQTKLIKPSSPKPTKFKSPDKQINKLDLELELEQEEIPQNLKISANNIEIGNQTSTCSSSLFLDNIFEIDQKTFIKNEEILLKQILELKEQINSKLDVINIYERLNKIHNFIEDACPQIKTHLVSNGVVFKEFIKVILKLDCFALNLNYKVLKSLSYLNGNEKECGNNEEINLEREGGKSFKLFDLLNKLFCQFLEEKTKNKIEFIAGTWNVKVLYMFIVIHLYSLQYKAYIKVEIVNEILVGISNVVLTINSHVNNMIDTVFKLSIEEEKVKNVLMEFFKVLNYLEVEVKEETKMKCLENAFNLYIDGNTNKGEEFVKDFLKFMKVSPEEVQNSMLNDTLKELVLNTITETSNHRSNKLEKLKGICSELVKHKNPQALVFSFYECLEGDEELFKEATEEVDEVYVNFLVRSIKRIEKSNEMKRKMVELNRSLFNKETQNEQINKKEIINLLKKRLFNKRAKVNNPESDNMSYPEVKNLIISPKKKENHEDRINELRMKLQKFDKYR